MTKSRYMYWVGMTTADGLDAEDEAKFNEFYSGVHAPEVVASNAGFVSAVRYELISNDLPGGYGPKYLAAYHVDTEASAREYIRLNDGPADDRPDYTLGLGVGQPLKDGRWRMLWRRVLPEVADAGEDAADYVMLIGMDLPPGTEESSMSEFNDFYDNVHLPEITDRGRWNRASRFELFREFEHPEPGAPRFLAVYEGDEATMDHRAAREADPTLRVPSTPGPPIWQARTTRWRLVYRRIATTGRVSSHHRPARSARTLESAGRES